MSDEYIKLDRCVVRGVYRLDSRNLSIGIFNGKIGFIGIRTKYGDSYIAVEDHWDALDGKSGTAKPLNIIGFLPNDIDLNDDKEIFKRLKIDYVKINHK